MEEHPGRRSIRLKGYDYASTGGYFVTIVARGRKCLFGEIINSEMQLNQLGEIVREEWFRSAEVRKEIRLSQDELGIMPNHLHGIIWIFAKLVGADGVRPVPKQPLDQEGAHRAPLQRPPRSLPSFIAGFKSSVTSRARRELGLTDIWQCNYYEHIIRDQPDYERIANYIAINPSQWEKDEENINSKRP
jgi:putative transposase